MTRYVIIGVIIVAAATTAANTAAPLQTVGARAFMAYGPTDLSCGGFTSATGDIRTLYEWWLLGFVSGADFSRTSDGLRRSDSHGVIGWVNKYCSEHPLDTFIKSAIEITRELSGKP